MLLSENPPLKDLFIVSETFVYIGIVMLSPTNNKTRERSAQIFWNLYQGKHDTDITSIPFCIELPDSRTDIH